MHSSPALQKYSPLQIYVGGWLGIIHQKGLSLAGACAKSKPPNATINYPLTEN